MWIIKTISDVKIVTSVLYSNFVWIRVFVQKSLWCFVAGAAFSELGYSPGRQAGVGDATSAAGWRSRLARATIDSSLEAVSKRPGPLQHQLCVQATLQQALALALVHTCKYTTPIGLGTCSIIKIPPVFSCVFPSRTFLPRK